MTLVIIVLVILLTVSGVSPACGRAEYLIGQECCPMCGPGYYVWRHCTEFKSTTCVPCPSSTYIDAPNGLVSCTSCTVCDSSEGLRVKRVCSSTSDTLCEPLEGHYCTDPIKDGCQGAVEHTKCSPGQYINQTGTASTDTVCGDCVGDTYSNGSFPSCRSHTRCEFIGLVLRKGSSSYDTDCFQRQSTVAIVAGIIAGVLVLAATCVVFIYIGRKRKIILAQQFLSKRRRQAPFSFFHVDTLTLHPSRPIGRPTRPPRVSADELRTRKSSSNLCFALFNGRLQKHC